jgi:alpha-tubulin suppressor-like RCC1 family protein
MALRRCRNLFATPIGTFTRYFAATASSNNSLDHLAVLAWGSGSQGVLGLGNSIPSDQFEPVENSLLPPDIIGVGAGSFHSLAWTSEGELLSWGRNNEGQLGRALASNELNFSVAPAPATFLPNNYKVKSARGSGVATFVVTTDGLLLVAGSSKRGQLGLGSEIHTTTASENFQHVQLPGKVLSVAAGWGHAAALVEDGNDTKMFTWGWPAHGRLGHSFAASAEDEVEEALSRRCVCKPKEVELLRGVKINSITCGMDTTYAITQDGRLLSFGDNSLGQLGRPETIQKEYTAPKDASVWEVRVPRESNSAKDVKFRKIAPGLGHCLAVTGGGSVLSWGWNSALQLGLGEVEESEREIVYRPRLIFGVAKNRSAMIGAGRVHSVLITDELHQEKAVTPTAFGRTWPCLTVAYTWGSAANGRLGTGTYEDAPFPELVTSLDGEIVVDLACGMDHTLVLVGREKQGPGPLTAFSIEE